MSDWLHSSTHLHTASRLSWTLSCRSEQTTRRTEARRLAREEALLLSTQYSALITHPCGWGRRLVDAVGSGYGSRYCLSYTALLLSLLPLESVAVVLTVRVRPLAETTIRPVKVTLSPFLAVNANVWLFIFLYDRMSEVGSPVTG